jgi:hypothetical protein
MRQFLGILAAAYVVIGLCTGLVHYNQRDNHAAPEVPRQRFAVEALTAGLLWPLYIVDILGRYDARQTS